MESGDKRQGPIIVLIAGGHACGKKTAAIALRDELSSTFTDMHLNIELKDMADYLNDSDDLKSARYSSSKSTAITVQDVNDLRFPPLKPSRFDFDQLKHDIRSCNTNAAIASTSILIVHGLYALYDKELREMSHLKVFISSDADARLIRWIRRDVLTGANNLETVINQYLQGARAEMNDFINPTKGFSDVILPSGPEPNAISLLVDGIAPYISKLQTYTPHLRATELNYRDDKSSFYELN